MSFFKHALVLASAFALTSLAARADTITTGNENSFNGTSINFAYNGSPQNSLAGDIVSTGNKGGSNINLAFVYCVDLNDDVNLGTTYNANYNTTGSVNGAAVNNAAKIAWLVENLATSATTASAQAGLQAAIWETEYGNAFTLSSSNSSAVLSAYNADLAALGNNSSAVSQSLWITPLVSNGKAQGLVAYQTPPAASPVPEPATLSLLGTGVLGLAGAVRRRFNA